MKNVGQLEKVGQFRLLGYVSYYFLYISGVMADGTLVSSAKS